MAIRSDRAKNINKIIKEIVKNPLATESEIAAAV